MASKRPTQAGMTLIELLIAVAIGAIVLAALNSVVSLGLQAQASGRQGNELVFQARFALERMITTARSVSPKLLATTAGTTCGGGTTVTATNGGTTVTLPAGRSIPANGSCTLTVNVTAAVGGSYINTLPANALVTNNGNNARQAVATLTVIPSGSTLPTLGQAFSPASINADDVSTLTLTLSNPYGAVVTLTAPLNDFLPGWPNNSNGVRIAPTPNVSTTCGGVGAPVAVAGTWTVTLPAGRSIPAYGSCTLTVNVTAANQGSIPLAWVNTLPAGALVTSNGNNAAQAVATLTVIPSGATLPRLGKAFSPASINAGEVSTLTVTLSNPDSSPVTLTAPLIDTLPSGVVIAATPAPGTTSYWFSPVMYCLNVSTKWLIETTTADTGCTDTTKVIARNVTAFSALSAQLASSAVPVDRPAGTLSLTLDHSAAPQPVTLSTSVRLGGGTL